VIDVTIPLNNNRDPVRRPRISYQPIREVGIAITSNLYNKIMFQSKVQYISMQSHCKFDRTVNLISTHYHQ